MLLYYNEEPRKRRKKRKGSGCNTKEMQGKEDIVTKLFYLRFPCGFAVFLVRYQSLINEVLPCAAGLFPSPVFMSNPRLTFGMSAANLSLVDSLL